jgi:23S rRNA A2030 N6-methylase RlmJ
MPLCEVLAQERPSLYAETHAGSAAYEALDNAERRYGVHRFDAVAARHPALTHSRYTVHLRGILGEGHIPGSPLLAMLELGTSSRYVLCDMDPGSTKDLSTWADRLGLADRVTTVTGDGMAAVAEHVRDGSDRSAVVHVDPYDPHAREPGSLSALELTARLIASGVGVMYWYGFDAPDQRRWALDALGEATDDALWCGDMLVTTADGAARADGHLGRATTPGTGFGIVLANVSQVSTDRCRALGAALVRAYDGAPLPDGRVGALDFLVSTAT